MPFERATTRCGRDSPEGANSRTPRGRGILSTAKTSWPVGRGRRARGAFDLEYLVRFDHLKPRDVDMPVLGRVFQVENADKTMIVLPLGPAMNYLYKDVHTESNGILEEFMQKKYVNVLIDLSKVDYIDSIIIGAIIRVLQKAKAAGGHAIFCHATENMQEILESIKIGKLWPLYATREEALAALQG